MPIQLKKLQIITDAQKLIAGVELDFTIMTKQQYNRTQVGKFKKSVEQNKTEIKVI